MNSASSLSVLFFLAACGSSEPAPAVAPPAPPPPPDPPAAPAPPPAPPAAAVPDAAALTALGACRDDDGNIVQVIPTDIPGGSKLLEVTCAQYAYQVSFQIWLVRPGSPPAAALLTPEGEPLTAAGLPDFDPSTGGLSWLSKARGPGDCGDFYRYTLQGETFALSEHRSRDCDDHPGEDEIPPPTEWPLVP